MRAILTYHSIDPSGSPISVSEEQFARHVRWLASGQVRVVPLEEMATTGDGSDAVAITFDDGFENFAACAAGPLREHNLPVTVFVVTGRVGMTNAWGGRREDSIPELPLLSWTGLAEMQERGVSLGAHSRSHPRLGGIPQSALADEIEGSANDLRDRLGVTPRSFAYPYGSVSAPAAALVRQTFTVGVTTKLSMVRSGDPSSLLPRLDMFYYREPGRLERWGSPAFRRHLWLRGELRRARGILAGRP